MAYGMVGDGELKQWAAAVDWLTCTWADTNEQGAYAYVTRLARDAAHQCDNGQTSIEHARVGSYRGTRCGKTYVGLCDRQGVMLRASGATAHWVASHMLPPDNVSRLDVQVTLWSASDVERLPEQVARKAEAARVNCKGRPYAVRLEQTYGAGNTAYTGSRASDVYGRCYDKGRECSDDYYRNALRFEVEFKREWARRAYDHLVGNGFDGSNVHSLVARTYGRWGIEFPAALPLLACNVRPMDDTQDRTEKSLRWLETTVSHTIARLLTEGVKRGTILDRLGL